MVDVRAAQGYSVWKGETFVINGAQGGQGGGVANAGGFAWGTGGMYGGLNPEFWQAIDEIVAYIVGGGSYNFLPTSLPPPHLPPCSSSSSSHLPLHTPLPPHKLAEQPSLAKLAARATHLC